MRAVEHRRWPRPWLGGVVMAALLSAPAAGNQGLVVRDGFLGGAPAGAVQPGTDPLGQPADYLITPELGEQHGGNLFHSFSRFSIGAGETATFTGPDPVAGPQSVTNVISRVTGGELSAIDGTLRSTIPGADVYLLNPAGVFFGAGARLDVPGGFHVTTADHVRLGESGRFSATAPTDDLLTTAPVAAFGFLGAQPAPIETASGAFLQSGNVEALSFVGGDLTLDGTLFAPNGSLDLVSVASPGEVVRTDAGLDASGLASLGDIRIEGADSRALVSVRSFLEGGLRIRAGRLEVRNATLVHDALGDVDGLGTDIDVRGDVLFAEDGRISANVSGSGDGSDVVIRADRVELRDGSDLFTDALAGGSGQGGDITLEAGSSVLLAGSPAGVTGLFAATRTGASGDSGSIRVATPALAIRDGARIQASSQGDADVGNVRLEVGSLDATAGGQVSTASFGSGNAGDVDVLSSGDVLIEGVGSGLFANVTGPFGGDAGGVTIDAERFTLADAGAILATNDGLGDAGNVTVRATESVQIDGTGNTFDPLTSRIVFETLNASAGDGGDLLIEAPSIEISDFAIIRGGSAGAEPGGLSFVGSDVALRRAQIANNAGFGFTTGEREGGDQFILFDVDRLTVDENTEVQLINDARVPTPPGRILVRATDSVEIVSGAFRAESAAISGAGTIDITAPSVVLGDGATLSAAAITTFILDFMNFDVIPREGAAGGVFIQSGELRVDGGEIVADAAGTFGGDIRLEASEIALSDASIRARVFPDERSGVESPRGGSIDLTAGRIALRNGSEVSTSAIAADFPGQQPALLRGGDVGLTANEVVMSQDSSISSTATGTSLAGSIRIDGARDVRVTGSEITTEAEQGDGGNVGIEAEHVLRLNAGTISASVTSGDGGNVTIDPTFVILENGSRIVAQAIEGNGGNIQITTDALFVFPGSVISASSAFGVDGVVQVNSPTVDVAGSLATLPQSFLATDALLAERCAARADDEGGSFTVAGRLGAPAGPDGPLPASVQSQFEIRRKADQ